MLSAPHILLLFASIIDIISSEYYLSYNKFARDNAETFCQTHCQSNLASVHSRSNLFELEALLANQSLRLSTKDIWIGLSQNISDNQYQWTDSSPFDWDRGYDRIVANTTQSSDTDPYFTLTYAHRTDEYIFQISESPLTEMPFICNECEWNVLTKYAYVNDIVGNAADPGMANYKCMTNYGTTAASIHSETDYSETQLIFGLSLSHSVGAYIGLKDESNQNAFMYSDGTAFDYLPNNLTDIGTGKQCVIINKTANYAWNTVQCLQNYSVVCNAPTNKLCDEYKWTADKGEWLFSNATDNCDVYNYNSVNGKGVLRRDFDIRYRLWSRLSLEYVFKMDINGSYASQAYAGIVIGFNDFRNQTSTIVPYYIGLQLFTNPQGKVSTYLFVRNKITNVINQSYDLSNDVNVGDYNVLRVEFDENSTFSFVLNGNNSYLLPMNVSDQIPDDYYIKSINIQNGGIPSTSKALYYNGWGNFTALYTTLSPTPEPTPRPIRTKSPTEDCRMDNAIYSEWSDSYLQINIFIPFKHNRRAKIVDRIIMDEEALKNSSDCRILFAPETLSLLGASECFWVQTKNAARIQNVHEDVVFIIRLASDAVIGRSDVIKFRNNGPIEYVCTLTGVYSNVVLSIGRPLYPWRPKIILCSSTSTSVGICDKFVLDARSSTNMGGRENGEFEWKIVSETGNKVMYEHSAHVELDNSVLEQGTNNVTLTVTNWYNETTVLPFTVFISDKAIPRVALFGTKLYRSDRPNLQGMIAIASEISFNQDCLAETVEISYNVSWSATAVKLYNDSTVIDWELLAELNWYLNTEYTDIATIYVDATAYLQPGLTYDFHMHLFCSGDYYEHGECNIDTVHEVVYDYSALKCGIFVGDINLKNIDPIFDGLNDIRVPLNGDIQTWDPDQKRRKLKTHLRWSWQVLNCTDCPTIFDYDPTDAVIDINLSAIAWEYSAEYLWEFEMEVYDGTNLKREGCFDRFVLEITTLGVICVNFQSSEDCLMFNVCHWSFGSCRRITAAPTSGQPTAPSVSPTTAFPTMETLAPTTAMPTGVTAVPTRRTQSTLLVATVTTVTQSVATNGNVNLIGDIINRQSTRQCVCERFHRWVETNGKISDEDIENWQQTINNNSANLVIEQSNLVEGETYSFGVVITEYLPDTTTTATPMRRRLLSEDTLTGYGESTGVDIFIYKSPTIHQNSFVVDPACVKNYDSISELVAIEHTFTLSADDEYAPLLYQFGYIDSAYNDFRYHFSPSLVSESFVDHMYLPALRNFTIFTNVINSVSALSTDAIQCSIALFDYSKCLLNWKQDIIDAYIDEKTNDVTFNIDRKYSYIFQQITIYLQYLFNDYTPSMDEEDTCVVQSMQQIFTTLDEFVVSNDTCAISKWTISLAETMHILLDFIALQNMTDIFYVDTDDSNYLMIIQELLRITLDPCQCIDALESVDYLYVSTDSMITQLPYIFYKNDEITECLSPIISNKYYHFLLDSVSKPVIYVLNFISFDQRLGLYKLLLDAMYIKQLSLISTAIPGSKICVEEFDEFGTCAIRIDANNDNDMIVLEMGNTSIEISNDYRVTTDVIAVNLKKSVNTRDDISLDCDNKKIDNSLLFSVVTTKQSDYDWNETLQSSQTGISVTFPCNGACDDSFECVWFNDTSQMWQNNGCDTVINYDLNEINCDCLHAQLTVFATIHNNDNGCNDSLNQFIFTDLWDTLVWVFFALFLIIYLYSVWLLSYYLFAYKWETINICVLFLIGITTFAYISICLFCYFGKREVLESVDYSGKDMVICVYTLLLLLPQSTYFMVYSILFYSWFACVHALKEDGYEYRVVKLKYLLIALNIFLCVYLIVYFVMVFQSEFNPNVYTFGADIWSFLLIFLCILFGIYSCFYNIKPQSGGRKLVIVLFLNNCIAVYIVLLALSAIYFAMDALQNHTLVTSIAYYIANIMFLSLILYKYRQYLYSSETKSDTDIQNMVAGQTNPKTKPLTPVSVQKKPSAVEMQSNGENKGSTINKIIKAVTPGNETIDKIIKAVTPGANRNNNKLLDSQTDYQKAYNFSNTSLENRKENVNGPNEELPADAVL